MSADGDVVERLVDVERTEDSPRNWLDPEQAGGPVGDPEGTRAERDAHAGQSRVRGRQRWRPWEDDGPAGLAVGRIDLDEQTPRAVEHPDRIAVRRERARRHVRC